MGSDAGVALRRAAHESDLEGVKALVALGANINERSPDMVFPHGPTPVALADANGDLAIVRYLVDHGADIMLKDEYGDRPFTLASDHAEIRDYLKAREPEDWHDRENRLKALARYKLPQGLIALLCSDRRRIELADCITAFIEFHTLVDVKELKWAGASWSTC